MAVLTDLQNYIKIMIDQLQNCEDELQKFDNVRDLKTITGTLLDFAGEIVGEPRNGREDEDYRIAIQYRILLNGSNGEPETVIQALRIFTGATEIFYLELYPAKILLSFKSNIAPPSNLRDLLEQIAPTGVKLGLSWIPEGEFFDFAGEGGLPPASDGLGFGETGAGNEDEGGQFVEII